LTLVRRPFEPIGRTTPRCAWTSVESPWNESCRRSRSPPAPRFLTPQMDGPQLAIAAAMRSCNIARPPVERIGIISAQNRLETSGEPL
jgi:hypothetical protein